MNKALKVAKIFVGQIQKAGYTVQSAFLFGSYAKNNARKDSDIDICVVSPKFGKDYLQEMVNLQMIARKIDLRIEAHPFTQEDLVDPYNSLSLEIRTTGLPVTT